MPIYGTETIHQDLAPFEGYLERHLERRVEIVVAPNYGSLGRSLRRGEVEFAAVPPLEFILTRAKDPRIQVVASQTYEKARTYQGMLVVRADGPLEKVGDLRGKRLCLVDRESTSGYLIISQPF